MKIAIVYDVLYPERLGGGEKRNWEIARRLAAKGHEVWLVTTRMWDGASVVTREGVHCVGICAWKQWLFARGRRSFLEPLYFAWFLFFYLLGHKFDVIDCGSFPYLPCISARLAAMLGRGKLVITWYEVRGLRRWIEHRGRTGGPIAAFLEKAVSRLKATHSAISEFTKKRAIEVLGVRDMKVVPCGVDSAAALQSAGKPRLNQVLYVGRLAGYKRVDMLVDAFAALAGEMPGLRLKIVGRGECRQGLVEQAVRLGLNGMVGEGALERPTRRWALHDCDNGGTAFRLREQLATAGQAVPSASLPPVTEASEDRVFFVDSLDERDLRAAYAESKAFVLPSEQEGFGIVLVEAMAAGTPVIALDAPNSAAGSLIINGEDGLLVETKDELTAALRRVLTDESLCRKLSSQGLLTARRYDWDAAVVPEQAVVYGEQACLH